MTDDSWPPTPGDDAELSAYLAGDLDDLASRRLEARLAEDPDLAARLDAVADTLIELRRVDDVDAPAGLAERVHARVAAETPTVATPAAAQRAAAPASARAARDGGRRERSPRRLGAVAAAVAAVALVGGVTLLASPTADDAAEDAADGLTTLDRGDEAAPQPEADTGAGEEAEAPEALEAPDADRDDAVDDAERGAAEAPDSGDPREAVVDSGAVGDGEALLGMTAQDAETLADERWAALADGPALQDGSDPSACRQALADHAEDVVVPVDAQSGALDGRQVVAYLVAVGTDALDRLEVVTVAPSTCQVLDRQAFDPR